MQTFAEFIASEPSMLLPSIASNISEAIQGLPHQHLIKILQDDDHDKLEQLPPGYYVRMFRRKPSGFHLYGIEITFNEVTQKNTILVHENIKEEDLKTHEDLEPFKQRLEKFASEEYTQEENVKVKRKGNVIFHIASTLGGGLNLHTDLIKHYAETGSVLTGYLSPFERPKEAGINVTPHTQPVHATPAVSPTFITQGGNEEHEAKKTPAEHPVASKAPEPLSTPEPEKSAPESKPQPIEPKPEPISKQTAPDSPLPNKPPVTVHPKPDHPAYTKIFSKNVDDNSPEKCFLKQAKALLSDYARKGSGLWVLIHPCRHYVRQVKALVLIMEKNPNFTAAELTKALDEIKANAGKKFNEKGSFAKRTTFIKAHTPPLPEATVDATHKPNAPPK